MKRFKPAFENCSLNRCLKFCRFSTVFLLMFFLFQPARALVWDNPAPLEKIQTSLPDIKSIKCGFYQQKFLPDIEKPIVSSGSFEFIENEGVYFHIKSPVQAEINYTNKNYKQINDVINALSNKKYNKLEKEFDFYYEEEKDKDAWILGLKPKEKAAGYLSSVVIEGRENISRIKIELINGCITKIVFKNI